MQFYTVALLHTAISATLYLYAPVRSKRPVGARLHSHRGAETNPANRSRIASKFGWYGKSERRHAYSIGQMQFYTVALLHTAISATLYLYAPVRSKRPVGARLHSHRGAETNPANRSRIASKFGWYGKSELEIGLVRKRTIPFPYEQKRQVQFRSTFWTCWLSTGTYKCISLILSQYIRETLFFCRNASSFLNKLLNFNLSEPQNSFFEIILPVFF